MNVKAHVKKHKVVYITGGICLAVGVGAYVGYRVGCLQHLENQVNPKQVNVLSPGAKQTVEVYIEALGDPGNIIQDTTTGTIYASQRQAARELGLEPSRVSEQVRGLRDHVNGHKFEFLGKAKVSEPV